MLILGFVQNRKAECYVFEWTGYYLDRGEAVILIASKSTYLNNSVSEFLGPG